MRPTLISSYDGLLAASGKAPLVRHEVGPELLAPGLMIGRAVMFVREDQTGAQGVAVLGPREEVSALLASSWRSVPGYAGIRSVTVEQSSREALVAAGGRGIGDWGTMAISSLAPRRVDVFQDAHGCLEYIDPASHQTLAAASAAPTRGLRVDHDVPRAEARSFVAQHYSSRWLASAPPGEVWAGVRDSDGTLRATGMGSLTPAGYLRLAGITVPTESRGQGLGHAVTRALVEIGLAINDEAVLGVDDDNFAARKLYAAMGFRLTHTFSSGALARG